jgi:hypothetical protein
LSGVDGAGKAVGASGRPPRRRRRAGAVAALALLLVAALAAGLTGYDTSLHPRNVEIGVASAKVLVDATESELTTAPLQGAYRANLAGQLAVTYALYLQKDQVTAEIGQVLGLHGARVAATGPFTLLLRRTNLAPKTPTLPDPIPVDHAYRLVLDVDGSTPVLTLYGQAPTVRAAVALVDSAREVLQRHVAARKASYPLSPEQAVALRPLGPTVGGLVDGGARWQLMGTVLLLVVVLGGGLLYARGRGRRRRAPVPLAVKSSYMAPSTVHIATPTRMAASTTLVPVPTTLVPASTTLVPAPTGGDWPHTTRILPWALAGFVAMLFLAPFDALHLPVSLPLDSNIDRPLLVALVLLWLASMAVLSGAARPRVRLTRVHFAALAFFVVCCVGVGVDGAALANMDEVTLVLKKLALLASYLVFFFVVASALRAREVPRFAVLIVALGSIVAVATVAEYRLHYNVFYALWGKLLPIVKPPDLDAPDSIGRLTVYGPTSQPLELAALLAMVLPFAVMGAVDSPTRRRRLLYSLAIGLLLAGGVATSRKTSLVAPAGAMLLLLAYRPRALARSLLGLAVVLGVVVHVTSPGALGSVLSQLEPGHVNGVLTTTDRTARYDAVAPDVMRHLLLGRGFASYDPHKYRILDNEYLGLLITTGAIGVAAYLAILAAMMSLAHRTIRDTGPLPDRDPRSHPAPSRERAFGSHLHTAPSRERSSLALAALACIGVVALASTLFDVLSFPHVPYLLFFVAAMVIALRERAAVVASHAAHGSHHHYSHSALSAPRRDGESRGPLSPTPRTRRSPGEPAQPSPTRLAGG